MDLSVVGLHGWEPVRCLGKSICERLNGVKVVVISGSCEISMIEAVSGLQIELREAKSRADAQC